MINAKELYEAYDGLRKDVVLHITEGDLTERKMMSLSIRRSTKRLENVDIYSFNFDNDCLEMYADAHRVIYNVLMKEDEDEV